jgi:hypothetical protein
MAASVKRQSEAVGARGNLMIRQSLNKKARIISYKGKQRKTVQLVEQSASSVGSLLVL